MIAEHKGQNEEGSNREDNREGGFSGENKGMVGLRQELKNGTSEDPGKNRMDAHSFINFKYIQTHIHAHVKQFNWGHLL